MKTKELIELNQEESIEIFNKMIEKLDLNPDVNEIFHNLKS